MPDFATELKDWRKKQKLVQKQAAEILNVNLRTYQGWEYGAHQPSPSLLGFLRDRMKETVEEQKT